MKTLRTRVTDTQRIHHVVKTYPCIIKEKAYVLTIDYRTETIKKKKPMSEKEQDQYYNDTYDNYKYELQHKEHYMMSI